MCCSLESPISTGTTFKPSTRADAIHLTETADIMLAEVREAFKTMESGTVNNQLGFSIPLAAELRVWHVILSELVRQVYIHCEERGALLNRVRVRLMDTLAAADAWCSYFGRLCIEQKVQL